MKAALIPNFRNWMKMILFDQATTTERIGFEGKKKILCNMLLYNSESLANFLIKWFLNFFFQ